MYVSVGPRTEEFDIVSNNHGRKKKCDFFVFDRKHPFWANLVKKKKNQNCQCKLKFSTKANSNTQNSMVMFSFFVFDWEYTFWANLAQQIKIVSLS